ncbi:MAG: hypothetical protein ACJAYU_001396 [Bradymonadia bacterium]|jgi:hypothetical protein
MYRPWQVARRVGAGRVRLGGAGPNYFGHDAAYQMRRAAGLPGWDPAEVSQEVLAQYLSLPIARSRSFEVGSEPNPKFVPRAASIRRRARYASGRRDSTKRMPS